MQKPRLVTNLVFIVAGVFFLSNDVLYAQNEPQPAQEEKISQEVPQFQAKPQIRGYTYNLKRLLEQAQENVKKIDEEIKQDEIKKRKERRELECENAQKAQQELERRQEEQLEKERKEKEEAQAQERNFFAIERRAKDYLGNKIPARIHEIEELKYKEQERKIKKQP